MSLTLDQAALDMQQLILEAVEDIDDAANETLRRELARLAQRYYQRMSSTNTFRDRSGDLRRSMFADVSEDNVLTIGMLFYGYFLNFGVKGREARRSTFGVTGEVADAFGIQTGKNFGPSRFGIDARNFYPRTLLDDLDGIVANVIQKI